MKSLAWQIAAPALFVAALATTPMTSARAQLPPPNSIFDLALVHPTALTSYTTFSVGFIAGNPNTTVSFAFREAPEYFAFDNVSVSTGGGANLLADPGFETSTVGSNFPDGWTRFIQPVDMTAIGQVASAPAHYGCNVGPSTGAQFWCDGSVEGYDGLSQTLATTVGQTYTVAFDLEDDSGQLITNPSIDMLVYAANSLPGGTMPIGVPEPGSIALLLSGLAGLVSTCRMRGRRTANA